MEKNRPSPKRQKIAFCLPSFRFGGGERVMVDVANWTAAQGYEVDLVVLSPLGQYQAQVDPRIRIVPLRSPRLWLAIPSLMRYLWRERPGVMLALDEGCHIAAFAARALVGARTRIVIR